MAKKKLNSKSQKILSEFQDYRENTQNKNFKAMEASIKKFLFFTNEKDINLLSSNDYCEFLKKMVIEENINLKTIKGYNSYLISFFEYLESKGYQIQFLSSCSEILDSVIEECNPDEGKSNSPFSLAAWVAFRQNLEKYEEYELLFYLEIIYQFELSNTTQIKRFNYSTYKDGVFHIDENNTIKSYKATNLIKDLIKKGGMPTKDIAEGTISYRLQKFRKYTNRKVVIGDILQTRMQNFFKCPNCYNLYESIPENWVIFDYGDGNVKTLVCRTVCYEGKLND